MLREAEDRHHEIGGDGGGEGLVGANNEGEQHCMRDDMEVIHDFQGGGAALTAPTAGTR